MERFLRSKIATVGLSVIVVWVLVLAVAAGVRRYGSDRELTEMQSRIGDAQRENKRLAQELERMQQPQWLALLARQRLNYKQPDETVVFVYKTEKSDTIVQPSAEVNPKSNIQQWWDWLRGEEAGLPAEAR